jgi:hypothetical protein
MNQELINLALAVSANEILHNFFEIKSMRDKLKRLTCYMSKKPYKELPINIDTRLKSYTVSFIAFFIFVIPLYFMFSLLTLEQPVALELLVGLLIIAYSITAVTADRWHVEIEKITRPFKNKVNKP